jgi:hypothetical protein
MSLQIDDLRQQSTFTFVGTVKQRNAATMDQVPVTDRTAIVTVEEVLQAPPMLADLAGTDVTVELSSAQQLQEGQRATFFTNGWIYSQSIAVKEVGHVEGRVSDDHASELAAQSPGTPENRTLRLQQRLAEAEVAVTGTVSSISVPEQRPSGPISEHNPEYREATIDIASVEKGDPPQDRIKVVYAASDDVEWRNTPTFHVGQSGIFLLNKQEIRVLGTEEYAALSPLDHYPPEQIDFVRSQLEPRE